MVQSHIYFTGNVQGVGFRYTTERMARALAIKGFVKNLPNGSVELLAQAPRPAIEKLIAQLNEHFGSKIHDTTITWQDARPDIDDFRITY